jgi:hypothetical protein
MLAKFADYADFLDSEAFVDDKGFNVSARLWQHSLPSTVSRIPNRCVARNQGKLLVKPSPCWPFCCSRSAAAVASPSNVELADMVDTEAVYWRLRFVRSRLLGLRLGLQHRLTRYIPGKLW